MRAWLDAHNVHHAYAPTGRPTDDVRIRRAHRGLAALNERFLHYPLPYLDEVRFAKNVAWVLTPDVPTDLPGRARPEEALTRAAPLRREDAGRAVAYDGFVPPRAHGGAGPRGAPDGDPPRW